MCLLETGGRRLELKPEVLCLWRGTEAPPVDRLVACPVADVLFSFCATPYVYWRVADFCCYCRMCGCDGCCYEGSIVCICRCYAVGFSSSYCEGFSVTMAYYGSIRVGPRGPGRRAPAPVVTAPKLLWLLVT